MAKQKATTPAAEMVAIDRLKPWARNPRKNDGKPVDEVAASIQRFGFGAPILARLADGEIIGGHTRYKAAQKLGLTEVPVRFLDLSESEAHALALSDNRTGELAAWDDAELLAILRDVATSEQALAGTGFSNEDLDALVQGLAEPFRAPPAGPSEVTTDGVNDELKGQRLHVVIACADLDHAARVADACRAQGWEFTEELR